MAKERKLEDWSFDELVSEMAGVILKGLLAGRFESSVHSALVTAMEWSDRKRAAKAKGQK